MKMAFVVFSIFWMAIEVLAQRSPAPPKRKIQTVNTFQPQPTINIYTNVFITNFYSNAYTFITNITIVTNIVVASDGQQTTMLGSVIDPALGHRQTKEILGAIALTIVPFDPTNWATIYLKNPERKPVFWPSTNVVTYKTATGLPPDPTEPYPSLLFENVFGKIFATP